MWQVCRYNIAWGIPDYAVLCFGSAVLATITDALTFLPTLVMIQKLAPEGVEASILAIMYSIYNFMGGFLPQLLGTFINNQFVGMTKDDLSKYKTLV